ncbi:nucleotide sugar dehydrogenase [Halobium salinum]|uniref:UDP-N-acetyl-D-mannosamine dehydrogenase n=1 Tax=Halobium salinum TaxID=1364940 RepID=A0ABD5PCN2_9EURY|nr:nucleotide sugar dehydrogenase [Halobium salinum]
MKVCVIGLGYVGLPTALLAARNHEVVGVDVDESKVDALDRGEPPLEEPALVDLFHEVEGRFEARTDVVPADAFVIVTPTPLDADTEVADLAAVRAAAEAVEPVLTRDDLVVVESTVPPGTTERLVGRILERSGLERGAFSLAHCPERAIPGDTLNEMVGNARLLGAIDDRSAERAADLYSFVEGDLHRTTPRGAEFVKLMENTYRDVNIALANEFAKIAEELGVDVHRSVDLANEHPRVDVHRPGPGVGGHCITIDPQFLAQSSTHDRLISQARAINDSMAKHVLGLVQGAVGEVPDRDPRVTLLGVAYKGDVGDTRETPARPIARLARNVGFDVRAYDPHVESDADLPVELDSLETATAGSDCLVVVTDHSAFANLDSESLATRMRSPTVVDARAVVDRSRWEAAGFEVVVLGDGSN